MTRYRLTLEYDGTNLIGWQENRQGPSVQSLLKDATEQFCGARPEIVAAGRTDAGVHAVAMVAHMDLDGGRGCGYRHAGNEFLFGGKTRLCFEMRNCVR